MTSGNIISMLISFLTSEQGLSLLAWAVGTAVTAILGTDKIKNWLKEAKIARLQKAYKVLEAAIVSQRETVTAMKEANGGGLTEEQKKQLEASVIAGLVDSAKKTGFDALEVIGPELIQPAIVHVVRRVKGAVVGKDATVLPSGTAALFPDTNN